MPLVLCRRLGQGDSLLLRGLDQPGQCNKIQTKCQTKERREEEEGEPKYVTILVGKKLVMKLL